tara:strand:- start:1603 stop:2583 length:981 start_codon:yes stop_codon:yes gene_type:complete
MKQWWKRSSNELSRYSIPRSEVARTVDGKLRTTASEIPLATSRHAKLGLGLQQICTTCDYPVVSSLLNLLLIWIHLSQKGALFLKAGINYFEVMNQTTRTIYDNDGSVLREGYLNFLHYYGAMKDYMISEVVNPEDLVYNNDHRSDDRREWIKKSWNASRMNGNIWFHMFPHGKNGTNEAGDELFDSKLFSEIAKVLPNTNAPVLTNFAQLVDGGLVHVAQQGMDQTETSLDLIDTFFGQISSGIAPDCTATAVDGAMNGALGIGMVAPGLVGMGIPGGLIGALSLLGAAVGGITGYESSKASCCMNSAPNSENCSGGSVLDSIPL